MRRSLGRRSRGSVRSSTDQTALGGLSLQPPASRLPIPTSRLSTASAAAPVRGAPVRRQSRLSGMPKAGGTLFLPAGSRSRGSSIIPFSGRPSSISTKGKGPLKDPRHLNDKSYQNQLIRKLSDFLTKSQYPFPVTHKQLQAPSSKDFVSMFQYVFSFIDPSCKLTAKFDEEVPLLLKQIGYPFPISKKALLSVGNSFTWPQLLGAFSFLIDATELCFSLNDGLVSDMNDFGLQDEDQPSKAECEADFLKVSEWYAQFLVGDLEIDQLTAAARKENDHACKELEAVIWEQQEEIARLEAVAEMGDPEGSLKAEKQREKTLQEDLDKFRQFICDLDGRIEYYEQHLQEEQEKLHKKEQEVAAAQKRCDQLKDVVDSQSVTAEEMAKMKEEHRSLAAEELKAKEALQLARQDSQTVDMQYSKVLSKCEKALETYHGKCRALELIPTSAANANGREFELKLDLCAGSASHKKKAFLQETRKTLVPLMDTVLEEDDQQLRALEQTDITNQREYAKLQAAVRERENALSRIKADCEHTERELKKLEKKTSDATQQGQNAYTTSLSELEQLRQDIDVSSRALNEKERHIKALQKSAADDMEKIKQEETEYVAVYRNFQHKVENHMRTLHEYEDRTMESMVSSLEQMSVIPKPIELLNELVNDDD